MTKGKHFTRITGPPPLGRYERRREGSGGPRADVSVARGSDAATAHGTREGLQGSPARRGAGALQQECPSNLAHDNRAAGSRSDDAPGGKRQRIDASTGSASAYALQAGIAGPNAPLLAQRPNDEKAGLHVLLGSPSAGAPPALRALPPGRHRRDEPQRARGCHRRQASPGRGGSQVHPPARPHRPDTVDVDRGSDAHRQRLCGPSHGNALAEGGVGFGLAGLSSGSWDFRDEVGSLKTVARGEGGPVVAGGVSHALRPRSPQRRLPRRPPGARCSAGPGRVALAGAGEDRAAASDSCRYDDADADPMRDYSVADLASRARCQYFDRGSGGAPADAATTAPLAEDGATPSCDDPRAPPASDAAAREIQGRGGAPGDGRVRGGPLRAARDLAGPTCEAMGTCVIRGRGTTPGATGEGTGGGGNLGRSNRVEAEADDLSGLKGGMKRVASAEVSTYSPAASRLAALRRRVALRSTAAATASQDTLCNRVDLAHAAEGSLCARPGVAARGAGTAVHFVRAVCSGEDDTPGGYVTEEAPARTEADCGAAIAASADPSAAADAVTSGTCS